jgi:hypothetical protein
VISAAEAHAVLIACALLGPATSARAEDIPLPVHEVMDVTTDFWSAKMPKQSIFSEDRLQRLYSADFVRHYRAAMKHPIYQNGDTQFDFDVIVQAQDRCMPEDIDMHLSRTAGAKREYEISFARLGCFDGGDPKERTTIYVDIINKDGRDVIDDIATYEADGRKDSTKVLMANIAQGQADRAL